MLVERLSTTSAAQRGGGTVTVEGEQLLEYLKKVTIELHDARTRLAELEQAAREPVALVGVGCRYPGGVRSVQDLWALLAAGGDAVSKFPDDRGWDLESLYDPQGEKPNSSRTDEGGFIRDVGEFDAAFFGIGPTEALMMDPQQRLLLEVTWEAIENAGIDPMSLRDSQTGVFAGVALQDYSMLTVQAAQREGLGVYVPTGGDTSVLSGRIAYTLGLRGPAITLETACSSSLVALHMACRSLRAGECSMALAGGVTVLSTPLAFVSSSRLGGLASDGRCKSFAEAADGTGFSEGAGVLLLERASDARRLGHRVLALVRGSAVNQDGTSNGLTAPNGLAQERVIRQALADAGLRPEQVDAVDGHGTGTVLGDPIEVEALLATYGRRRPAGRPLWLGSIKSNLGHSAAAAGVAGVIKMAMALRHEQLPRTLHVDEPTGRANWSRGGVSLLTELVPWPRGAQPRRAGVSAFGMSGTNAHLILEEASLEEDDAVDGQRPEPVALGLVAGGVTPWLLSARSGQALCDQAIRLQEMAAAPAQAGEVLDVGFSLATTRSAFESRAVVVGEGREELLSGLAALSCGEPSSCVAQATTEGHGGRVAFVCPGHGSQWAGMASALLDCSPLFASCVEACERAFAQELDWSLTQVLTGAPGAPTLDRIDVVQPALFAMMVSLAELWRGCGVVPEAVVGHSQGEIAAAHIAGALSLPDAARLIARRSRLLAQITGVGRMASVALGADDVAARLGRWSERLVIAAVNGPRATVVSGEEEALEELLEECAAEQVRVRKIAGALGAGHSPLIETLREQLLRACPQVGPLRAAIAFYSTVAAERLDTATLDREYWYRNAREPVRFEAAVRRMLEDGFSKFIELSPHPVLSLAVADTIDDAPPQLRRARVVGSLRRGDGGPRRFVSSLGEAWTHGVEVDWRAVFAQSGAKRVSLPTYPFQRRRYWLTPATDHAAAALAPPEGFAHAGSSAAEADAARNSLARRLSDEPPERRARIVLEAVLEQVTAVVEDVSANEIDPHGNLLELGFDSIAALELHGRLCAMSGLRIPTRSLLERPTPEALAGYIDAHLSREDMSGVRVAGGDVVGEGATREDGARVSAGGTGRHESVLAVHEGSSETLSQMLREARDRRSAGEFMEMLMTASKFRPAFGRGAAGEIDLECVKLSDGPAPSVLICLPTALALSGPHQYVRFARTFCDSHSVLALALPGFAGDERVPESLQAAVETLALAVERHCEGTSFVLVGYSSGGWLAHEVAAHMERKGGARPAAVVLLDSHPVARGALLGPLLAALGDALAGDTTGLVNDRRLAAMGAYLRLLQGWQPAEIAAPTLLAKAVEALPGGAVLESEELRAGLAWSEVEAPGNHITMMEEHVDETARAVQRWLSATLERQAVTDRC